MKEGINGGNEWMKEVLKEGVNEGRIRRVNGTEWMQEMEKKERNNI